MRVDGPYGEFQEHPEWTHYNTLIIIAGGIGVSPDQKVNLCACFLRCSQRVEHPGSHACENFTQHLHPENISYILCCRVLKYHSRYTSLWGQPALLLPTLQCCMRTAGDASVWHPERPEAEARGL